MTVNPPFENNPLRIITLPLIRKRSEHNESMVSNLEEIALHQEELEAIGPILGRTCGKTLRILLLQNNVISKMNPYDLKQFKVLEYLNLALNNVELVEGIQHLEHLNKLDLTLNFIDVDHLEASVENMKCLRNLKELFLMGNPCCPNEKDSNEENIDVNENVKTQYNPKSGWRGYRMYIIASLTQVSNLDGVQITRSERIVATQNLTSLTAELCTLAESCRELKKKSSQHKDFIDNPESEDEEVLTSHTPHVRSQISNEMARQKAEKEERERANQPKSRGELELEQEQNESIQRARERELRGDIKQCNEGKWVYSFNEEKKHGFVLLDISLPKFLSSSLIDIDIHPTYISIVIKSKVLRLLLPAEVKSDDSSAQRSTTTGNLLITMEKVNPNENMVGIRATRRAQMQNLMETSGDSNSRVNSKTTISSTASKRAVRIKNMVPNSESKRDNAGMELKEICTKKKNVPISNQSSTNEIESHEEQSSSLDDEPPPLF